VSARSNDMRRSNIGAALFRSGQKVEDGSIMPNIIAPSQYGDLSHIGAEPSNTASNFSEALPCDRQGSVRYVENCNILETTRQEIID
jgi:hypothetical protein